MEPKFKADCKMNARACFVRLGRDPDSDAELFNEIQREMEAIAEGQRRAGRAENREDR